LTVLRTSMMPPMSLTVLVTRTTISVEGRNIGYPV